MVIKELIVVHLYIFANFLPFLGDILRALIIELRALVYGDPTDRQWMRATKRSVSISARL